MFTRLSAPLAIAGVLTVAGIQATTAASVSNSCQSTVLGIASDSEASSCLNAQGLINLYLGSSSNSSTDLVSHLNDWVTGVCSAAPCSNDTLAAIVQNVTSGCSAELSSAGLSTSSDSTVISTIQGYYPTVREILCLKNSTSNNLCVTDDLNTVQSLTGAQLTLDSIFTTFMGGLTGNTTNLTSQVVCNDCSKAAYSIVKRDYPSLLDSDAEQRVEQQCGADFVNGETPSSVTSTASNSTASSDGSNAAFGLTASPILIAGSLAGVAVFIGFA